MYNGIGLTTARGSGTNGHVQRNWAAVRPKKDNISYKTEEDLAKLDAANNRQPNQGILDHERKRQLEVKCAEYEEILEKQNISPEEVQAKVNAYRSKLMGQGKGELPKDEFGRVLVRETHQIAEAQQEKNAKLREAFGISEYFVEGSSFDPDRKAKEDLKKSTALQDELQAQKDAEREKGKRYALVRTPSKERGDGDDDEAEGKADKSEGKAVKSKDSKKKKKKRNHDDSSSPERKKDKKKSSKKHKKDRKKKKSSRKHRAHDSDDSSEDSESDSSSEDEAERSRRRKKSKKDKKKRDKKKKAARSDSESRSRSPELHRKKSHSKKPEKDSDKPTHHARNRSQSRHRSRSLDRMKRKANSPFSKKSISPKRSRADRSPSKDRKQRPTTSRNQRSASRSREQRRSRSASPPKRETVRRRSVTPNRDRRRSASSTMHSKRSPSHKRNRLSAEKRTDRKRSRSPKRNRSPSPRKVDRNRSPTPRRSDRRRSRSSSHSRDRNRSPSRKRTPARDQKGSQIRDRKQRSPLRERKHSPSRKRSPSRNRKRSRSPRRSPSTRNDRRKSSESPKRRRDTRSRSVQRNRRKDSPSPDRRNRSNSSRQQSPPPNRKTNKQQSRSPTPPRRNYQNPFAKKPSQAPPELPCARPPPGGAAKKRAPSHAPKPIRERSSSSRRSPLKLEPVAKNIRKKSPSRPRKISEHASSNNNAHQSRREEFLRSPKRDSTTPPPKPIKQTKRLSPPKRRCDSSESDESDLSYSPARRDPDRYKDIQDDLDKNEHKKASSRRRDRSRSGQPSSQRSKSIESKKKPQPVVRLHPSTDSEESDADEPLPKVTKPVKYEQKEDDPNSKENKLIKALSGIAAKAKEKIKTISDSSTGSSSNYTGTNNVLSKAGKSPDSIAISREMAIANVAKIQNASVEISRKAQPDSSKPSTSGVKSLKINEFKIMGRQEMLDQQQSGECSTKRPSRSPVRKGSDVAKPSAEAKKPHDRKPDKRRRSRSGSSSASSQSSRSHSRSSRSRSSSSGSSSSSSSNRSRSSRSSRSPSIPRRRGSPSFLDRRRITSARKRPIPYKRPQSDASSVSSTTSRRNSVSPFQSPIRSLLGNYPHP